MRSISFVIIALLSLLAGCARPHHEISLADIGRSTVVLGELGRPIGEELTIHGRSQPPGGNNGGASFLVDRVNGKKLNQPLNLDVLGIDHWLEGTEATIRGYENGKIR